MLASNAPVASDLVTHRFELEGIREAFETAAIKSVAKIEHINCACGSVFNMRLHPLTVQERAGMAKWSSLIRTYFDLGGWELQFNTVDVETLRDAQRHPDRYRDLLIRVVGYSAHFVQLDRAIQDDIISRTEHALS